jgi:hypothetical protein
MALPAIFSKGRDLKKEPILTTYVWTLIGFPLKRVFVTSKSLCIEHKEKQ